MNSLVQIVQPIWHLKKTGGNICRRIKARSCKEGYEVYEVRGWVMGLCRTYYTQAGGSGFAVSNTNTITVEPNTAKR